MKTDFEIVLWDKRYNADFIRLNKNWIEKFFKIEDSDRRIFENPEKYIIDNGGQIFLAVDNATHTVVGCCALVHHPDNGSYELAKMAVDETAQGRGIGYALGCALVEFARQAGVCRIFLEANTRLKASVGLYHKLGFEPVSDYHAAYDRCDLYMVLKIK